MRTLWIGTVAVVAVVALTSTGAAADRLITGRDIKDGSIALKDLKPTVRKQVQSKPPARTSLTPAIRYRAQSGTVLSKFGATPDDRIMVGKVALKPGTYLVNVDVAFDRIDDAVPSEPRFYVRLQPNYGDSDGPIFQPEELNAAAAQFPATGDQTVNAHTASVVQVFGNYSAWVYAWGVNDDGSVDGAGNYTARLEVSAVKIAD